VRGRDRIAFATWQCWRYEVPVVVEAGADNVDVLMLAVSKLENTVNSISRTTKSVPYLHSCVVVAPYWGQLWRSTHMALSSGIGFDTRPGTDTPFASACTL
jgi:hypothetical protein